MPERSRYAHLFKGNPFAGNSPDEMFSILHWGRTHQRTFDIDAPEALVMLGTPKFLVLSDRELHFKKGEAFLAVGRDSNQMYLIPRRNNEPIKRIPKFSRKTAERIGLVLQTDYLSSKGRDREVHYYHKHEKPFPCLWIHQQSGVGYIRAANHDGKPSYAVGREGIVG